MFVCVPRLFDVVAGGASEDRGGIDKLGGGVLVEAGAVVAEDGAGGAGERDALVCDGEQRRSLVLLVRHAGNEALAFETADGVGERGWRHVEPGADFRHGQRAGA